MEYKPKPKGAKIILAEIEKGVTDPEQIAANTGYKISTVYQYLSEYAPSVRKRLHKHKEIYISEQTQQIIDELSAGERQRDIVRRHNVTRQWVSYIKRKYIDEISKRGKAMKVKLDENAYMPTRAHADDAGLDLYARETQAVPANGSAVFDTGVHIELPRGTVGMLKSKSGLNVKHGLTSEGVIDVGYTGSICVKLYNNSDTPYLVNKGDKISQLVIMPILTPPLELVDDLEATERGTGGFGSTGK